MAKTDSDYHGIRQTVKQVIRGRPRKYILSTSSE